MQSRSTRRSGSAAIGGALGGRGGGIRKRGGRDPPRIDRDGDAVMGVAPQSGPGSLLGGRVDARGGNNFPRGTPSGPRRSVRQRLVDNVKNYAANPSKTRFSNSTNLKVSGVHKTRAFKNPDHGEEALINFLEKKIRGDPPVTINKLDINTAPQSVRQGESFLINVSKNFVSRFLAVNGYEFVGHPLSITETDEPWPSSRAEGKRFSQGTADTASKFRSVISARYNPETKFLNLAALGQDSILSEMGTFNTRETAEKAFRALLVLADEFFKPMSKDAVKLISLGSNALDNVSQVFDVAIRFPTLLGLDLSNNNFSKVSQLSRWRGRFPELQELRFAGNPMVTEDASTEFEMLQWFPTLLRLDEKVVRTPEQVAELIRAKKPVPIPQLGADFRDVSNVGENFLREFFSLFDNDRAMLVGKFYDEDSVFSLSAVTISAKSSPDEGALLNWRPYLRMSRNTTKLGRKNSENQRRSFRGQNLIADAWKLLPKTQHPPLEDIAKWTFDAHVVSNLANPSGQMQSVDGLVISVSGEFQEWDEATGKTGRRTLNRHFVLGPAKPGRTSAIRVVSDQLTIRHYQPPPVNEAESPTIPSGLSDELRRQMVQGLSDRTNMTLEYAEMCLAGPKANWNFHLGLLSFEELKHNLDQSAFKPLAGAVV